MDGPYKDRISVIYKSLRKNLIQNLYQEWKQTGFIWEQYSGDTGSGKRSHPFTGWSSLILLIMSEKY